MRDFLKSRGRWVRAGWFWPLVLLALPNCQLIFPAEDWETHTAFDPGAEPRTSAIMCDIPYVPDPSTVPCADALDLMNGMPKGYAAVALVQGEQSSMVLDFSPAAMAPCNNFPQKIGFYGPYPDGFPVCFNAATQFPLYGDGNGVCIAQCKDLINAPGGFEPPGGTDSFCQLNARVSTNFDKNSPFFDVCSSGGTPIMLFNDDPRRDQEPIKWITQNGTNGGGNENNLTRTSALSGNFDAGAYSDSGQAIAHGDGWVEFSVSDNTKAYAVGVSPGVADSDETLADIAFAIVLIDTKIFIFESGVQVGGSHGMYNAGDRFRVTIKENLEGKAAIAYTKLNGPCAKGMICDQETLDSASAPTPPYPLRVDVSLVDPGALLTDVRFVHIRP